MNPTDLIQPQAMPSSWPMLRAMGGVGIFCALLIVATYQVTLPVIEHNKAEALGQAVFEVIPGATSRETFAVGSDGNLIPGDQAPKGAKLFYAGYNDNNELVGIAIEASGQGFQDIVRLLYGYDPGQQALVGLTILESKETPGLGTKIETDETFLLNFESLDVALVDDGSAVAHPITAVKPGEKKNPWEVSTITGATISSKAVANILRRNTSEWLPTVAAQLQHFKDARQ